MVVHNERWTVMVLRPTVRARKGSPPPWCTVLDDRFAEEAFGGLTQLVWTHPVDRPVRSAGLGRDRGSAWGPGAG